MSCIGPLPTYLFCITIAMEHTVKRQLASVQRISHVMPHPGADALDICRVLGWSVITKRNEYSAGDLCVYCEIDSILPDRAEFEFLRKNNFRIRTIRLRGSVSQGICFPLSVLSGYADITSLAEGDDVTDALGVEKWEPPLDPALAGELTSPFPHFLEKTDETRIQSLRPEDLDAIQQAEGEWVVTEKLDGSSMTIYLRDGAFGVCSRNLELQDDRGHSAFWKIVHTQKLEDKLRDLANGRNICIQGELIGTGIQGNKYQLQKNEFHVFRMYDIDTREFFSPLHTVEIAQKYGFQTCPVAAVLSGKQLYGSEASQAHFCSVEEIVSYSVRRSAINNLIWQEGFVFANNKTGNRLSFKVLNPEFLLKYD